MAKKFISVINSSTKYRVFLDDLKHILKRSKKVRPDIPIFKEKEV